MIGYMAEAFGGTLAMMILTLIVERFAYRSQEPNSRAAWTVLTAFVIGSTIAGFGNANGGPFVWTAGLTYLPGAFIVWFFYRRRLLKAWEAQDLDTFA